MNQKLLIILLAATFPFLSSCLKQPTSVADAICTNDARGLESLLKAGHSANQLISDDFQVTPLLLVSDDPGCGRRLNSLKLSEVLLKYGAQVDGAGPGGRTALMAAMGSSQLDVVKLLVARGADVNHTDIRGHTPLMSISSNPEALESVKFLVESGADTLLTAKDRLTAVAAAKAVGNTPVVEYLEQLNKR
jgi:uncharacterized protein